MPHGPGVDHDMYCPRPRWFGRWQTAVEVMCSKHTQLDLDRKALQKEQMLFVRDSQRPRPEVASLQSGQSLPVADGKQRRCNPRYCPGVRR